jgi:hypothetical protein
MSKLSADLNIDNLKNKVKNYEIVIENTTRYREIWQESLKQQVREDLEAICTEAGIKYELIENSQYINLDSLILSLGNTKSGIYQEVEPEIKSHLIRHNGSLLYQQIFNGKILVQVHYPMIDKYLEPRPPKTIAIYRPEEIKTPFILRHIETLISEITAWEDYDDDENVQHSKIGFTLPHELPASEDNN